ncbi:TolB family protein [Aestuariimicrobium ganziense]|uniref:TolB family protein n=1 Tax=Aestuariimicrobium ganziense TaxID=2773677 RepID=UPI00194274E9|nr:PD40 domain-containing protein [Aestuariimicrobium ganziense]
MAPLKPGQRTEVWLYDIETGEQVLRWSTDQVRLESPNWTEDDRLVLNADGDLFTLSARGDDAPVKIELPGLPPANNDHCLVPGTNLMVASCDDKHLYLVDLAGGVDPVLISGEDQGRWHYLHGVSPDGREVAWTAARDTDQGRVRSICCSPVEPVAMGTAVTPGLRQVTPEHGQPNGSEYSPDGQWIWINSEKESSVVGHQQIFRIPVEGALDGSGEQFTLDQRVNWFPHLSPDGRRIVYLSYEPGVDGHPADLPVVLRELLPGEPDEQGRATHRDLVSLLGGQGTINVNSWAPDSRWFCYIAHPLGDD